MQGDAPFSNWLSDPRNQHVAKLLWAIKHTEAKLNLILPLQMEGTASDAILGKLKYCASLYSQLQPYYPSIETSPAGDTGIDKQRPSIILRQSVESATSGYRTDYSREFFRIIELWQQHSIYFKQSGNGDEKAYCIKLILDCLDKLIFFQKEKALSGQLSHNTSCLSLEQLSAWFLSFIDLIRRQHDSPSWASDFFQQLSTSSYHDLYQMLMHADTAHLMFHIYYYKLFPDQLSLYSKHPDFLLSLDQRLSFLYQCIEQFVELFISFSKTHYQLTPKNFLCHGNQLPKGITLRSKEAYRQLIIDGLKKLNSKATLTEQTAIAEIIDAIFRSYQFWFNPCRLLDAVFMLCKRFGLCIHQPFGKTLYNQMVNTFQFLETDDCIHLYGYFSNNDTRYLFRVLYFISQGGTLTQIPPLTTAQIRTIDYLYQALTQVVDAISETLSRRHLPCHAITVDQTPKPPTPSKRNLQAVLHVIETYSDTAEIASNLDNLLSEIEKDVDAT